MRQRISLVLLTTMLIVPAIAFAVADPEPMKPVGKDKRRITERDDDRGHGGRHDDDRDHRRGNDRDRFRRDNDPRDRGPARGRVQPGLVARTNGQWVLGVTGEDTEVGLRVTSVLRGSPADRAGFERDDAIVNVGGYQVGFVDGRRYDLGEELQRHADPSGRVTLLVQNRRNGRLRNISVNLDWQPTRGIVSGRVSYRERIALPPSAVCFVELVEVDRQGRPVRVLEKQLIQLAGNATAPFQVDYDAAAIQPNRRYALQARVEVNGRVMMETTGLNYVITDGSPDHTNLIMSTRVYREGPGRGTHRGPRGGTRIRK